MEKHPNQYLNEFVAHFVLIYLKSLGYKRTGTDINIAAWEFLQQAEIDPTTSPSHLSDLAHSAAIIQRRLVLEGHQNTSLRSVRHQFPELLPIISHGPQSWLINTYRPLLGNLLEVDLGLKQYGLGKDIYRNIEENVMAARMMFEIASNSLAKKLTEIYADTTNLGLVEGGSGNGAAMFTTLHHFQELGIYPDFLLSDNDPATKSVAEKYFRERGFLAKHFPWKQIDIGNQIELTKLAKHFPWHKLVINVNFIVHEWEPIAKNFFSATSTSLPNADLVVSEFLLPPKDMRVGPDFPWWFIALHKFSGQHLRTEKELMKFPNKFRYQLFDRIDYEKYNGQPVTSTLFLKKM